MNREFEATIIIAGVGTTPEALEFALRGLLVKAARFPPDGRFDWHLADVSADFYTANPKGKK